MDSSGGLVEIAGPGEPIGTYTRLAVVSHFVGWVTSGTMCSSCAAATATMGPWPTHSWPLQPLYLSGTCAVVGLVTFAFRCK